MCYAVQLAKNIVPICSFVSAEFMKDSLLPIILNFIREPNNEIALGIAQHFEYLSTRTNKDVLDENIIKPLVQQLTTNNWRNKC